MKETIEAWAEMTGSGNIFAVKWSEAVSNAWKSRGKTVVKLTGEVPRVPSIEDDYVKVTVDGVDYYDSKKELTNQEALDLAAKHGLRVLERWELCKLFDTSEAFRESLEHKWYWSASVDSSYRNYAWLFDGSYGYISYYDRLDANGVRCVSKKELSE